MIMAFTDYYFVLKCPDRLLGAGTSDRFGYPSGLGGHKNDLQQIQTADKGMFGAGKAFKSMQERYTQGSAGLSMPLRPGTIYRLMGNHRFRPRFPQCRRKSLWTICRVPIIDYIMKFQPNGSFSFPVRMDSSLSLRVNARPPSPVTGSS